MNNYYLISYIINIGSTAPIYEQELIDTTPLEYILNKREVGGSYSDRVILFAQKITKQEFTDKAPQFNKV